MNKYNKMLDKTGSSAVKKYANKYVKNIGKQTVNTLPKEVLESGRKYGIAVQRSSFFLGLLGSTITAPIAAAVNSKSIKEYEYNGYKGKAAKYGNQGKLY